MNKLAKKTLFISSVLAMCLIGLTGCSSGKAKESFEKYETAWINKDYKTMYSMLSKDSKKKVSEEDFVKRFNNIYSSIEATNIKIEEPKDISKSIQLNVSLDTVGGTIKGTTSDISIVEENKEYKVVWDDSLILPELKEGDKVYREIYQGKRGSIYDRNGYMLAGQGTLTRVNINPRLFAQKDIPQMAKILDISEETIKKLLDANTNPEYAVKIVDMSDSDLTKLSELSNIAGVSLVKVESRIYNGGEALGSLVGYIGNMTAEQLEKNPGKGYTATSKIGKTGLEQVYEDTLRATDGGKVYIEKTNGDIEVLAEKKSTNGKDLKLSVDTELQQKVYTEMNGRKGASVSVDPKTGEVLAMVSSPSYDSNTFATYKTKTDVAKWEASENAEFENRFNNVYSPGSTMKLVTASIGLSTNTLNPNKAENIKGTSWSQYKVTRVKDPGKSVNLKDATKFSDNIYFAKAGLNIGGSEYVKGAKKFGIGDTIDFDYPMENSQISNSKNLDNKTLLVHTSYGQGEVMVSPLNVALMYSAFGNDGKIMTPRLDLTKHPKATVYSQAIDKSNLPALTTAFASVVNDTDGSGHSAKISGFNLVGKTGTAEIKKSQDDTTGTENGWFVATNTGDSKICTAMILEDVKGQGGSHAAVPLVKNIMEYYLTK